MSKKPKKPKADPEAPVCMYCNEKSVLTTGAVIYPHRPDLRQKSFFQCKPCNAFVGCHRGTKKALGLPAKADLRRARRILHNERLDPIWKNSLIAYGKQFEPENEQAKFLRLARERTYAFLAHKLGIERDDCHTGLFTIERCREAWHALEFTSYETVRLWAKQQKKEAENGNS